MTTIIALKAYGCTHQFIALDLTFIPGSAQQLSHSYVERISIRDLLHLNFVTSGVHAGHFHAFDPRNGQRI